MKITAKKFFNIPNTLSVIRIILVPFFVVLYLKESYTAATIVTRYLRVTDCIDGFIARHFNQITEIGKMLDPFADKLTQAAVAVVLAVKYRQVAPLLALFIIKELCMLLAGFIMLKHGKRPTSAQWWGKLATIIFYGVMIIIVAFGGGGLFGLAPLSDNTIIILVSIAAVFMIFSFINYLPQFIKYCKEAKKSQK